MIVSAPPGFVRSDELSRTTDGATTRKATIAFRGNEPVLADLVAEAKNLERNGDTDGAIRLYQRALRTVAEPLNNLAWLYHQAERNEEALPMATLANQMVPDDPTFADTLADITSNVSNQ